jgi:hypothetical protein
LSDCFSEVVTARRPARCGWLVLGPQRSLVRNTLIAAPPRPWSAPEAPSAQMIDVWLHLGIADGGRHAPRVHWCMEASFWRRGADTEPIRSSRPSAWMRGTRRFATSSCATPRQRSRLMRSSERCARSVPKQPPSRTQSIPSGQSFSSRPYTHTGRNRTRTVARALTEPNIAWIAG